MCFGILLQQFGQVINVQNDILLIGVLMIVDDCVFVWLSGQFDNVVVIVDMLICINGCMFWFGDFVIVKCGYDDLQVIQM